MACVRETWEDFTDEELIQMVKESMDELGIAYEEGPGDWSGFLGLDPADFDTEEDFDTEGDKESYMLLTRSSGQSQYRAKASVNYAAIDKNESGCIPMAAAQPKTEPPVIPAVNVSAMLKQAPAQAQEHAPDL